MHIKESTHYWSLIIISLISIIISVIMDINEQKNVYATLALPVLLLGSIIVPSVVALVKLKKKA